MRRLFLFLEEIAIGIAFAICAIPLAIATIVEHHMENAEKTTRLVWLTTDQVRTRYGIDPGDPATSQIQNKLDETCAVRVWLEDDVKAAFDA